MVDWFDAVVMANGHHSVPNLPHPRSYPGQDSFGGKIIHSSEYKRDTILDVGHKENNILVVGSGNCAVDIACDLSSSSSSSSSVRVFLSLRQSMGLFFPKYIAGKAFDHVITIRYWFILFVPKFIRPWFSGLLKYRLIRFMKAAYGGPAIWGLDHRWKTNAYFAKRLGVTIHQDLLARIGSGAIEIVPGITSFEKGSSSCGAVHGSVPEVLPSVQFTNGIRRQMNTVIFCTGYRPHFPFLSRDLIPTLKDRYELFKQMIPPEHPTLAFVGLLQTCCFFPTVEMRARWLVAHWSMQVLPSSATMRHEINRVPRSSFHNRLYHGEGGEYLNDLAEDIGCAPLFLSFFALVSFLSIPDNVGISFSLLLFYLSYRLFDPKNPWVLNHILRVCGEMQRGGVHHN